MRGPISHRSRLLALLAALLLLAAACGDDGDVAQDAVDEALADLEEAVEGADEALQDAVEDAESLADQALEDAQEAADDAAEETDQALEDAADQLEQAPDPTEAAPADDAEPATADGDQTAAVVAARDTMLAVLPAGDFTTTPEEPVVGSTPEEGDGEDNPLDRCLPPELQGLEARIDELKAVEATGTFTATTPGAFGAFGGELQATAYTDTAAIQQLLTDFGAQTASQPFLDCVEEETRAIAAQDAPTDDFTVVVTSGIPGVTAEVALNIVLTATFQGETVNFQSSIIIASRGDLIIEVNVEGDGADPFPADLLTAITTAV